MPFNRNHNLQPKLAIFLLALSFTFVGSLLSSCEANNASTPTLPLPAPSQTQAPLSTPLETANYSVETALPSPTPTSPEVPLIATTTNSSHAETTPTPRTPPAADAWTELPVIPTVSDTARQIFQRGLSMGRNPHAFSKIGDCQSITTYFLALFDKPGFYVLGSQTHLQETIDWFSGSFQRESLAVKGGLNAAAILSPLRADPKLCQSGEAPVVCELRINNPSLVIISLEEWWADDPTKYEQYMRQILDQVIAQGVVPILATKADNLEGNHLINQTIAQLAWEYDIPLWNFWQAVQPLPHHGLINLTDDGKPDMFHLTHGDNHYNYSDLQALKSGWAIRNLTALQVLDAVWRGLNEQPQP